MLGRVSPLCFQLHRSRSQLELTARRNNVRKVHDDEIAQIRKSRQLAGLLKRFALVAGLNVAGLPDQAGSGVIGFARCAICNTSPPFFLHYVRGILAFPELGAL